MTPPDPRARFRSDLWLTLLFGLLLLGWDATGWDLTVMRTVGHADGFALRDTWWTSRLLHEGGRALAWVLLALLVADAARASARGTAPQTPTAAERWRWIGVMLLVALAVPAIKRISHTSCPWDLAEFGGSATYVSHWHWGLADGGSGHCFPSGHAVAAFAFFGLFFLWRPYRPARARAIAAAIWTAGLLFGGAQLLRGAHYPSHTLWTAWFSWAACVVAARWFAPPR